MPIPGRAIAVVIFGVLTCSIHANLSCVVTSKEDYRFFPPFKARLNENRNFELGGENFEIAKSLVAGKGFSSPFREPTGPTAWMPPALPVILAALLWLCDGNKDAIMVVMIVAQVGVLIATGLLTLALAGETTNRVGVMTTALAFVIGLSYEFMYCFQRTHDSWLVLLALDLLIAGLCWWRPLRGYRSSAAWGVFGGLCTLISPVVGFAWGGMSLASGLRNRAWGQLTLTLLIAGLTLLPWTARNYLVLGRLIPVKSNLAYELYQSQCLQPDGVIQRSMLTTHPYASPSRERQEYKSRGEIAFLDRRREWFWQAVHADPLNFLERVGDRFLATTLWYLPFDRIDEAKRPWSLWSNRLVHPLPFLGLLILLSTTRWPRLHRIQWCAIGVYLFYLLPYIVVSYYGRYAMPLLGVKVLLVIWGCDRLRCLTAMKARS